MLADEYLPTAAVRALVAERNVAELSDIEIAVMEFAQKVVEDATSDSHADVERLRALGLTDREILDVVLAAAEHSLVSKTVDALCAARDDVYGRLEPGLRTRWSSGARFPSSVDIA